MISVTALLLAVTSLFECTGALTISHWDLEGANGTCDGKATCEHETAGRGSRSRLDFDLNWRERNCMCDALCSRYGDCCLDSQYFIAAEQRRGATSFSCVELRQFGGIYMVTTCPPEWEDVDIRARCENDGDEQKDPVSAMPVTSHVTGLTYRNPHCAVCHSDLNHTLSDFWKPRLECPNYNPQRGLPADVISQALTFDNESNSWGLNLTDSGFHACFVDPVIPETSSHVVRRCEPNIIRTCAINWTNADIRDRCDAYTSHVYQGGDGYRNPHCAMCNNVPVQYLACSKTLFRSMFPKDFNPVAFAVLFDLSGGGDTVGMVRPCPDKKQLYDPFFRRCRSVVCTKAGQDYSDGRCITIAKDEDAEDEYSNEHPSNDHIYIVDQNSTGPIIIEEEVYPDLNETEITFFTTCPKFLLDQQDYELQDGNSSVYVPTYERTFGKGEFRIQPDGHLEICASSLGTQFIDKFGTYMGYVTFAGLGVSVVFLVLHLVAFVLIPELQNLSGKNLVSLCVSLLCAYCAFMLGQVLESSSGACKGTAILTYYGFLASFSWMLTMAFDVWRTLRLATSELRVSSGKQWRKFALYSAGSWLLPAAVVGAALITEHAPSGSVNEEFRPYFGTYSCWFGHRKALLVFFAIPLAVVMALNIAFFSSSAHMIFSTTSTTRFTSSSGTQRDFRLYIRLALVMGLTWTVGLIAGYLDMEGLWYAFIALNTLQGLFIFLAFTCTEKVVRGIADVINNCWMEHKANTRIKPRRPPSFSWSGVSSSSTHKSQLGGSSETSQIPREGESVDTLY
ncbi:uncharacterized protein [Anabrus simplex]|uniref:uncharacterized protein n=1 Tax=Anabrus simplex TaxID=316456 RepID=UPI0035A2DA0F